MSPNEIKAGFLLSEDETVEMQGILALEGRRREYAAFFYVIGIFLMIPAFVNVFSGEFTFQEIFYIAIGVFFAVFYDVFILRILSKQRARKNYRTQLNHMLSMSFNIDAKQFRFETDKYRFKAQPREAFKCIEAARLFIVYISSERWFSIPKRVLTRQEISDVRQVFQQSLPQDKYVSYGR